MDREGLALAGASRKLGPSSYPCPLRFAFLKRKPNKNSSGFAAPYESRCKKTSNQRSLLSQDKDLLPEMAQVDLLEVRVVWSATDLQPPSFPPLLSWVYWSKIIAIQLRCDVKIFPTTKPHFKYTIDDTTLY